MKLNTHDRTPRPKNSKLVKGLLVLCGTLSFSVFGLISFACFYYAQSIIGGVFVILIPVLLTAIILVSIKDMEKAYVEIKENEIYIGKFDPTDGTCDNITIRIKEVKSKIPAEENVDFDTWLESQPEGTFVQGGGIDTEKISQNNDKKD